MLGCLIGLVIAVIIAVIVLYILETALAAVLPLPPPVWVLLRLLVGLIILLYALNCLGVVGASWAPPFHRYP